MFHLQTTEIQPFIADCFSTKTLKFQQYDVIIYDASENFGILSGIWNTLVMRLSCAKFHHDVTINNGIIFCVNILGTKFLKIAVSQPCIRFLSFRYCFKVLSKWIMIVEVS